MTGANVGHYKVLGHLGSGGMSDVYLAEDLRLGRQVALKFLPPLQEKNPSSLERLRREARLTSALNHPHICTIHDIDEHDGQTFLVMERLEGTTLKRLLETNGALPLDRALRLGAQIADALAAAHAHGIVHRDVKPGNIFVTPRDDAKVTDFGLAKQLPLIAGSEDSTVSPGPADTLTLTAPGEAVGTIAYMSPEQARGEDVDARSDLFSCGAVLYEMITGRRAFSGSVPAVVFDQILNGTPTPVGSLLPGVPQDVAAMLARALQKAPNDRYQSGSDLRRDLTAAQQTLHSMPFRASVAGQTPVLTPLLEQGRPRSDVATTRGSQRPWGWIAAVGMLLLVTAATAAWLMRPQAAAPLTERDSVVLGTFANSTGDSVFDGTLREALAVHLGQSPFLNVLPSERLEEALRLMGRPDGSPLDHDTAREACERLNAKALIEGAIRPLGEHLVLSVTATGCASGETLVIGQNEVARKEEVLRGVGEAAQSLRTQLGESLSMVESFGVPIEQATTPSLDALKAYTLGQARRAQGGEIESVPFFERAVEIDPHFAMAWYALSLVYGNLGETVKGGEYGLRAYAERGRVSERERLAITYQYHDRVTGQLNETIATLELWKRLYPRDYRPANSLAVTFLRVGNYERAAAEARE
ncbi:MAG: protein kinase, partial [Vicinamibacterales bacterium]